MGNQCCHPTIDKETPSFLQYCEKQVSDKYKEYFKNIHQYQLQQINNTKHNEDYLVGDWRVGQQKTGKGVIYSHQSFYYQGDIVKGNPDGNGKIVWPNMASFKGTIHSKRANGVGQLIVMKDELVLKGQWKDGFPVKNKKMQMTKANKKIQITFLQQPRDTHASVVTDKIDTQQTLIVQMIFEDKTIYKGQVKLKNNVYQIQGTGQLLFENGSSYYGGFVEGKMHGIGKFIWGDTKHWYEGEYRMNYRDGYGKYFYNQSTFKEGNWIGGVLKEEKEKEQVFVHLQL